MSTSSRSGKKHFVDDVSTAVEDCLLGLVASSTGPRLQLVQGFPEIKVVVDADFCAKSPSERPVALISGGGSGHEPGQAGYVGEGMLAAAVCGDIFASPSAEAVYKAIKATCGEKGRKGDIVGAFHSTPLYPIPLYSVQGLCSSCKGCFVSDSLRYSRRAGSSITKKKKTTNLLHSTNRPIRFPVL